MGAVSLLRHYSGEVHTFDTVFAGVLNISRGSYMILVAVQPLLCNCEPKIALEKTRFIPLQALFENMWCAGWKRLFAVLNISRGRFMTLVKV